MDHAAEFKPLSKAIRRGYSIRMGLNIHALRLLLHARAKGASLDRVITIGRLDVLVTPEQLEREFEAFGEHLEAGEAQRLISSDDRYCEPIIKRLGAGVVDSLDASDFEGANVIHDLNAPLPRKLDGQYSLLLDGGTLEHIFNFPEALKSCMSLVEVGGHALFCLPANNEMGHGFYQFSPDLFYRALSEENGYSVKGLYLTPLYRDSEWLRVEDPAIVGQRIGYNNPIDQLGLMVFAQRVRDVPPFAKPPQQSDYIVKWEGSSTNRLEFFDRQAANGAPSKREFLRRFIPQPLLRLRQVLRAGRHAMSAPDPSHFRPFDPRLG